MLARTFALVVAMSLSPTFAQSPPAPPAPPAAANAPTPTETPAAAGNAATIDPAGLPGIRMLGGGGKLPTRVYEHFLQLAGGPEKARVVLIPTASASVDDEAGRQKVLQRWQQEHWLRTAILVAAASAGQDGFWMWPFPCSAFPARYLAGLRPRAMPCFFSMRCSRQHPGSHESTQ